MKILHVAHRADWDAAVVSGSYRTSTPDALLDDVGSIHASYQDQLPGVAEFIYAGDDAVLCVLVLDPERIRAAGTRVADEDGGDGQLYPHVYGPIEPNLVTDVLPARFDASGSFRFWGCRGLGEAHLARATSGGDRAIPGACGAPDASWPCDRPSSLLKPGSDSSSRLSVPPGPTPKSSTNETATGFVR